MKSIKPLFITLLVALSAAPAMADWTCRASDQTCKYVGKVHNVQPHERGSIYLYTDGAIPQEELDKANLSTISVKSSVMIHQSSDSGYLNHALSVMLSAAATNHDVYLQAKKDGSNGSLVIEYIGYMNPATRM